MLFLFQVTEYTLSMKCVRHLRLFTLILGVYSVSSQIAYSYPVSRSNFSTALESDSVQLTRSSRDSNSNESSPSSRKKYSPELSPFAPGSSNLSIGVGQVFLMGNLANLYDNAIGTQLQYTYGVSDMFSFESNFGYSSHSSGNFSLVNMDTALRTNLVYFDQLIPYASVGLGFYHPSGIMANNATLSALLFGMELGAGVDLLLTKKVFFGTLLSYHNMFDSVQKASDGTIQSVGGSYISFMIHAGVTF